MVVAIIATVFTLVCIILAVFFGVRAYRGFKRLENEREIRAIIAMQQAQNLAREAKARKAAEPPKTFIEDETIPDRIPDKE